MMSFYQKGKARIATAFLCLMLLHLPAPAAPVGGKTSRPQELTLEQMLGLMKQDNPQLKQAAQNTRAAYEQVPQALAANNPQIGFVNNPIPGSPLNLGQSQGFNYTLTQSFPFPGKKRLAGDVALDAAKTTQTQYDTLLLQLAAQLKTNFYQMLVYQQQAKVNRETITRLNLIKKITRARYANNAAAYLDYLNAQVALTSAENDNYALQRNIENTFATLNTLIGHAPGMPLAIAGKLPPVAMPKAPLETLESIALERHPTIKGAEFQTAQSLKNFKLAKLAYMPDFNAVLTFNSSHPPFGITQVNSYGIELDLILPTWFFKKEKAGVAAARANVMSSRFNEANLRMQTQLNVTSAYNTLRTGVNQYHFIERQQLPQARAAFRLGLTNYANNAATFTDLLTAQNNLSAAQLALVTAQSSVVTAYANLIQAIGADVH